MIKEFMKKVALGAFIFGAVAITTITGTSVDSAAASYSGKAEISLNVRSGPGMEYRPIGAVNQGAVVSGPVVNGWIEVQYNGQTGYVSKYYVSGNGETSSTTTQSQSQGQQQSESSQISGRTMTVSATAYTHTGNPTATGVYPSRGTIAVDPSVIPLGTRVYVEGYGYATAQDTGGAIKGNKIDVFVNSHSEAMNWGRRTVNITILD